MRHGNCHCLRLKIKKLSLKKNREFTETVLPCPVQNGSLKLAQGFCRWETPRWESQSSGLVSCCCDAVWEFLWLNSLCSGVDRKPYVKLGHLWSHFSSRSKARSSVGGEGWMQVSLYSLRAKLWTQAEVCFPEEHSHSWGAFARGLTARVYLSNYLLHDLCCALHLSALKSFTASPTFCPQEQSINTNTLSQHSDWILGLTCTWGLQGGKVHLRVASGFWIDGSRCELFTLYSCVEDCFCSWKVWVIEMPRGLFAAWHSWL